MWRRLLLMALVMAAVPSTAAATSDPLRDLQWGLAQIRADQAWPLSTGEGATIAIVDSGVDLEHPDIAPQVAGGATFSGCPNGASPCGDGDWQSNERDRNGDGRVDGSAHGTHVAGIAAAVAGNGVGIAGVAPGARLLAVKVLGASGVGSWADIAAGVRWAAENGADVINLSISDSPGTQLAAVSGTESVVWDAIRYARQLGVVVVAAAGNNIASICSTPAFHRGVLCVAATDRLELRAAYSNLAVKQPERDRFDVVAAPGGHGVASRVSCDHDIVSTVPSETPRRCPDPDVAAGYDFLAGTSMAAPHVSGAAALLAAQGRDAGEIVESLVRTARSPLTGERGLYTPAYGYGIVDVRAAVADR